MIDDPSRGQFSRRSLIGAACGAAVIDAAAARAFALPAAAGGAVDVHSHYFPPSLQEVSDAALVALLGRSVPPPIRDWSPARLIESMDRVGTRTSVVHATWRPALLDVEQAKRRAIARGANDYGARMRQDHPDRIDFFGFVPMPDVDGALAEIAYCLDELKAPGVTMMTSYGDRWQGHPDFAPVLQELNRRRAVVLCHPHSGGCCANLMPGYGAEEAGLIEFPYDTGRAVVGLLLSGSFAKYPGIRWIFCHCGGPVPAFSGRIRTHLEGGPPERLAAIAPKGVDYELKRQFYETADAGFAPPVAAMLSYVPPSQILFGTDFPYVKAESTVHELDARGLKPALRKAISHENARRLMPGLHA